MVGSFAPEVSPSTSPLSGADMEEGGSAVALSDAPAKEERPALEEGIWAGLDEDASAGAMSPEEEAMVNYVNDQDKAKVKVQFGVRLLAANLEEVELRLSQQGNVPG